MRALSWASLSAASKSVSASQKKSEDAATTDVMPTHLPEELWKDTREQEMQCC